MPMTRAPETGTENPYQKTCTGFLQVCHANRYRWIIQNNGKIMQISKLLIKFIKPIGNLRDNMDYGINDFLNFSVRDCASSNVLGLA